MNYFEKMALLRAKKKDVKTDIDFITSTGEKLDWFTFLKILRKNRPDFQDSENQEGDGTTLKAISDMRGGIVAIDNTKTTGVIDVEDFYVEWVGSQYGLLEGFPNAYNKSGAMDRIKAKLAAKHYIPIQPTLSDLEVHDLSDDKGAAILVNAYVSDPDVVYNENKLSIFLSTSGGNDQYEELSTTPNNNEPYIENPNLDNGSLSVKICGLDYSTEYSVRVKIERNGMFNDPSIAEGSITTGEEPKDPGDPNEPKL